MTKQDLAKLYLDTGFPDFSFEFGDAGIPSVEEILDQTQGGSDASLD